MWAALAVGLVSVEMCRVRLQASSYRGKQMLCLLRVEGLRVLDVGERRGACRFLLTC